MKETRENKAVLKYFITFKNFIRSIVFILFFPSLSSLQFLLFSSSSDVSPIFSQIHGLLFFNYSCSMYMHVCYRYNYLRSFSVAQICLGMTSYDWLANHIGACSGDNGFFLFQGSLIPCNSSRGWSLIRSPPSIFLGQFVLLFLRTFWVTILRFFWVQFSCHL